MTLHLNYQQGQERLFVDHPSLEESMRLLREPINIDQCLKDFTKEEELGDDETWYDSHIFCSTSFSEILEIC